MANASKNGRTVGHQVKTTEKRKSQQLTPGDCKHLDIQEGARTTEKETGAQAGLGLFGRPADSGPPKQPNSPDPDLRQRAILIVQLAIELLVGILVLSDLEEHLDRLLDEVLLDDLLRVEDNQARSTER